MKMETRLVQFDAAPGDPYAPASTPIYQTATFRQPAADTVGPYDYSRSGNPTRTVLEEQLARLEGGASAAAFASGMAAIAAVASLVESGQEIVAGEDLYGGTYRLLTRLLPQQGIRVRFADTSDPDALARALESYPRLLLLETPSNPLLRVTDLAAAAALAGAAGTLVAVDNSLMSPYVQRPLELGVDLVIHSATKALGGHSDVTAGAVVCRDRELGERIAFYQNAAGNGLGPFDAWLLLRGMKTLAVRVERQQATAARLAAALARHPAVRRVHHPSLPTHPGRITHLRQADGPGSVLSVETDSAELSRSLVETTRCFANAVSFGGVASTVSLPAHMSHASIPAEVRRRRHLPEGLVRLSIGIEDPEDLLADLHQALGGTIEEEAAS